jgi:hypothetical protein
MKPTNRRRALVALAASAVVLVVAIMVAVRLLTSTSTSTAERQPVPPDVLAAVTGVDRATFATVGRGSATSLPAPTGEPLRRGPNGRPLILYVGAEYCPFCASERWPLVVALSRFGTFSGLQTSRSAADDVFPSTPTFTFYGASYQSQYVDFKAVEIQSNVRVGGRYAPLQTPTPLEAELLRRFDAPPYVPANSAGAIPFLNIADQFVHAGASFSPAILQPRSWAEIASRLKDAQSVEAQAIVGTANVMTAAICVATDNQPSTVCAEPTIQHIQQALARQPRPGGTR